MIDADQFIQKGAELGFRLYAGVPCSYLKPFINYVIDSDDLQYVGAANEGDAVAIAAGSEIGGQRAVAMFQNSGLGNAVNPLTSLTYPFRIPVLIITTFRGEPGGPVDEPQHELMGSITTDLLELMRIPWEYFPESNDDVEPALGRAVDYMNDRQLPYAFVMRKGSVAPVELVEERELRTYQNQSTDRAEASTTRREMLRAIQAATAENDVIIATTGYTGRELYACADRDTQLYLVGSMGCASSLGLGLALAQPARRVVVIDGDGAALMRLGAMCTIGHERPANLVHVLLDNGMHESTGGQATVSRSIDFCGIALASGYRRAVSISSQAQIKETLGTCDDLTFIHAPILPGITDELPRPSIKPREVAARMKRFLGTD